MGFRITSYAEALRLGPEVVAAFLGGMEPPEATPVVATVPDKDAMNQLERRYAERLKADPEIWVFFFQALKFRMADNTWYTPDFVVILKTGVMEVHETKGYWEEDARVKWKTVADMYPFPFVAITWEKKEWVFERYNRKAR